MKQIIMPGGREKDCSTPIYRGYLMMRKSAFTGDTTSYDTKHASSILYHVLKRMMDIVLAAAGMVVLMPVFLD